MACLELNIGSVAPLMAMSRTKYTIQWLHLVAMSRTKYTVQRLHLVAMSRTKSTVAPPSTWLHLVVMAGTKSTISPLAPHCGHGWN